MPARARDTALDSDPTNVVALTADFESWLGEQIPLVAADLAAKHAALADSPLRFLRGTYYLWLRRAAALVPQVLTGPSVPAVGDLHVENFGTWYDQTGARRWGVNDVDELAWAPYPLDLVRLATSVCLLPDLAGDVERVCTRLLDHWTTGRPGRSPRVDDTGQGHLRRLLPKASGATKYYRCLSAKAEPGENGGEAPPVVPGDVRAAVTATAGPDWSPRWGPRQAGTGSLGRPRFVAVGPDTTGWLAREVKLIGPPTLRWARDRVTAGPPDDGPALTWPAPDDLLIGRVLATTGGPHLSRRVDGWQVRALAPDLVRIDLTGLRRKDTDRVLTSMAQALLDVHGTDGPALAAARAHHTGRPRGWLAAAVSAMVADTLAAHRTWAATRSSRQ